VKTCFATVVTEGYMDYALVALDSLKKNSGFDIPCYVFCGNHPECNWLSIEKRKKELEFIYDNLIFKEVDYPEYLKNDKKWPHYWSHEVFKIRDYDRVIFYDADIICLKDITDIPEVDLGFTWEAARDQYYAGFFVVGKSYLNDELYESLMKHHQNPKTWGKDQAVYNEHFDKKQITELDLKYNAVNDKSDQIEDVRVLHYIYKPDSSRGKICLTKEQYNLWYDWLGKIKERLKKVGL